jgi:hypothetical protein
MNAPESRQNNTLGLFLCFIALPDFLYGLFLTGNNVEDFGIIMMLSAVFIFSLGLYNLFGFKGPIGLLYVGIIAGISFVLTEILTYPIFKLSSVISFNAWNIYYLMLIFVSIILLYAFRNKIIGVELGNKVNNNFLNKLSSPVSKVLPNKFFN